ncbi:tumor necrosis factor receptor superfamily member 1B [Gasterosteus aculeatus]
MKEILVVLLLLHVQTLKVCSQPYQADSDGNCLNSTTEYLLDDTNLCCKKCPPGHRQSEKCSETTETVCERCQPRLFIESWNYSPNCFSCTQCKEKKGLKEAQVCSPTENSRCVCQPGMFCSMGFDDPFCTACSKYRSCRPGFGVSMQGTADRDVRCTRCPSGTFSDTLSSTTPCLSHADCNGRVVAKKGNATSDNVCEPRAFAHTARPPTLTRRPMDALGFVATRTVSATSDSEAARGQTEASLSISTSYSRPEISPRPPDPPPDQNTATGKILAAVIAGVIGLLLFCISIVLVFFCKPVRKKDDAARFHPKVDGNGNCHRVDNLDQDYLGETYLNYIKVPTPEHQCLLQRGETCSDHSQCSNNTDTLTQTDGSSSQESVGPLQSTLALHSPLSVPSDPMTLLSHTEAATPQPNVPTQSTSQPTSPQVISPVTTSPHVNVNITFHIENRSCGTPSVTPTDLMQVDPKLPFGEEEESFSIPHQEAGKQSLMSVQESDSYRA